MRMEDMILVSIDDHMVEPPDMFERHVPAKWRDQAPKVVRNDKGADEWVFQGASTSTPFGMAATVGWPSNEWGFNPATLSEMRPGCFDIHERVRDMDANGVLASMCFPTMAGFNARMFNEAPDKKLSLVMLQAYNDWHIDEWCGTYPDRFIPLGVVPLWDVDLAVAEVNRIAQKGCRSISFLEAPHAFGLPSLLSGHWDPMLAALCDNNMVLSLHIGAAWSLITLAPEAGEDHLIVIPSQVTMLTAHDLLTWENACRFFGWDPFARTSREDATVESLRARAADVDTSRMPRAEWRERNEAAGIGTV